MPGAVLSPAPGASAIVIAGSTKGDPWNASLCLVDSRIELAPHSTAPAISGNRSIYLNQVYVRNAATLLKIDDAGPGIEVPGRPDGWYHVAEYAAAATTPANSVQRRSEHAAAHGRRLHRRTQAQRAAARLRRRVD